MVEVCFAVGGAGRKPLNRFFINHTRQTGLAAKFVDNYKLAVYTPFWAPSWRRFAGSYSFLGHSSNFMSKSTISPPVLNTDIGNPQPPKPNLRQRLYAVLKQGRLLSVVKGRLKPMVIRAGQSAMRHAWLKRLALAGLNYVPGLKLRLHRILWSEVNLSPRALGIYTELKAAIERQTLAKTEKQAGSSV